MEYYAKPILEIVRQGGSIMWNQHGQTRVEKPRDMSPADWGFNEKEIRDEGVRINWTNQEILYFLKQGFCTYLDKNTTDLVVCASFKDCLYSLEEVQ